MWKKINAVCDNCGATAEARAQLADWNPTPQKHKGRMKFKKGKGQDKDKLLCWDCWKA